jgi:hypothetical protein
MQKWANNVKNLQEDGRVKQSIIAANNHYAGFGPGTANIFRNMLGLPEAKWKEKEESEQQMQYQARVQFESLGRILLSVSFLYSSFRSSVPLI